MRENMSFSEIKESFEAEWILVENPETDDNFNIKHGVVLWHSKDRDEVYRKARELQPRHSAILYTGRLPDNIAVVL